MKITIIGSGYVGLVSGVCLASKGHRVVCVDNNPKIVESLNIGKPHIYEQGLEKLLSEVIKSGNFNADSDLNKNLADSDGVIVAVGTPSTNGEIDLDQIINVAKQIGLFLKNNKKFLPVVIKSTVIPGTTDTVVYNNISNVCNDTSCFGLGMNPEFLREGDAINDFMHPDRIVIGYDHTTVRDFLEKVYSPWTCDKLYVNTRTAEMIKYANNTYLANLISLSNELSQVASALGNIDMMDVINGVELDKRWNPIIDDKRVNPGILNYLIPGCGFGGSCLPKDVAAIRTQGRNLGLEMQLTDAILSVNQVQPKQVLTILNKNLNILGKRILLLGLAFKENTDDVRDSASIIIIKELLNSQATVFAHDPIAIPNFRKVVPDHENLHFITDWTEYIETSDVVILATKWSDYSNLQFHDLNNKIFFDIRRMFKKNIISSMKTLYIG